jgi:threonine/homoserine/homoserine lactone efflux protein
MAEVSSFPFIGQELAPWHSRRVAVASSGLFPQPLWINVRGKRELGQRRSATPLLSSAGRRDCYDRAVSLNLWAFAAITVPLVATPGASTAVVLRNSIGGGVRSGVATAVGVNAGSICYGLLTAFGVSAALQRWPAVWLALRVAGTVYLGWLGLRSLVRAWTYRQPQARASTTVAPPPIAGSVVEGFMTNALNPSIATYYLLILPQFIPRGAPFARSALTLTAIHVGLAISWHLTWAVAGGTLAETLGRTRPRRALEAITGVALVALAAKIALSR